MKVAFGLVSLLITLALVALLVTKQLSATRTVRPSDTAASAVVTVPEQAQQIQNKVRDDVTKILEQGARKDEPQP